MKKKVSLICLLLTVLFLLTACGGTFTCDLCGTEKTGRKHVSDVYGMKMTICDDCYTGIANLR